MKILRIPKYIYELLAGKRKFKFSFEYVNSNDNTSVTKPFAIDLLTKEYRDFVDNDKQYQMLIGITGIGAICGSSALTDFLGEFSCCTSIGGVDAVENPARGSENSLEVDFFRDVNGVQELEKLCDFDNHRILSGGITQFIELVKNNHISYPCFYDDYYLKITKEFILSLLDFSYEWEDHCAIFYIRKMTKNEYRKIAGKYVKAFLKHIPSKKNLVLDNILSIDKYDDVVLKEYVGTYKILTSQRDPRDVFTAARTYPLLDLGYIPKDPNIFIKYYKWFIERHNNDNPNEMLIRFEDFVLNYDNISKKIMDFIGITENDHIKKFEYFNPEFSKNNIGIYKSYKDQEAIKIIEEGLREYLWQ